MKNWVTLLLYCGGGAVQESEGNYNGVLCCIMWSWYNGNGKCKMCSNEKKSLMHHQATTLPLYKLEKKIQIKNKN